MYQPGIPAVRRPARLRTIAGLATAVLASSLAVSVSATAAPTRAAAASTTAAAAKKSPQSDIREIDSKRQYTTSKLTMRKAAAPRAAAATSPPVGTQRTLIGLDDYNGVLYRKTYTLKAVGAHIEVYVADDTAFPAGDCRAAVAGTTTVTSAQAQALADQFDTNMFPKESAAFSTPPSRDGSGNVVSGVDPSGDGGKIMTLVDNVRDDNYYLGVNQAPTYIAGFFSSQFNELLDRNIMTIDAYDWLHRTGANPPNDPTGDPCTSRAARPRLYEGTFAHEYQHLLQYYQDPNEVSFINEGLSDFAISLTGYGDATKTVFQQFAQSHIYCYQGFGNVETAYNPNPINCGGPENSLTLWGDDPNPSAILADYGEAWSFMLYLYDRYGLGFMSTLHRDGNDQGLVGVQHALDGYNAGANVFNLIHDFQTTTLVDQIVGSGAGGTVVGTKKYKVTSPSLNSTVNLGNPNSYAKAGAPANGADYVGLRDSSGLYLKGKNLKSLSFSGAGKLTPEALKWTSVANPPGQSGDAALWSGNVNNLDATALTRVTVPADNPVLTFNEYHLAEATYDYAYTVVSTDGGATFHALANDNTVDGPFGPALNGDAAGWATQTFDLSPYAGQSVVLGFRYVSDGGTNDGGWYVDDVRVGSTTINDGTTTSPFQSRTQIHPIPVTAWNVRVVGVDTFNHKVAVVTVPRKAFSLTAAQVDLLKTYPRVVAIVSYDQSDSSAQPAALYTLTVNGVVQPGGGQSGAAVAARADRF